MRYWIMDEEQSPQRFPLQRLLHRVIEETGAKAEVCSVLRASGYGLRVNELERELQVVDVVAVPTSELDNLCAGTDEWFYELEVAIPGVDVRFGLQDSTAMFVEGNRVLCESVVAAFANWRRA